MIAAPNFNLTIIYESTEAGKRAKRCSDQFIVETALDCAFELNLWNFGVLGIPEVRNKSASTASIADMVILSMSGTVPLSAHALEWIEMWIWLIDGRRPAVVATVLHKHRQALRPCPRGYLFRWEAEPENFDRMVLNRLYHRLSNLRLNGFTHVHWFRHGWNT